MEVSDQLFTQLSVCDEDEGVMGAIDILTGTDWYVYCF
jgi:hypothetical protein